ncbi:MAG: hypothetical protein F9K37_01525 [Bacteroidales bacterium]|nr:MAG: hypothetical protein F9K37_01525 [Bacteroidales bacterium]
MKQDWEIKKLGEVCEFKNGTTIDSRLEKSAGEVIYAKVGDMNLEGNEDYITISSRYVDLKSINQNQIIPSGSIIFPKRGGAIATNKKRRIIKPTIVDLNTMALVPSKIIDKDYLFFWFKQIDLSDLSNGTSIPQINNYSFDDVHISYPKSIPEQQRIVSILDQAIAAIHKAKANAEQNLKNAKELFESYLNSIKADKVELGSLVDIKTGKLNSNAAVENGDYPFFTCSREVFAIDKYAFDLEAILLAGNNASGDFNVKHYKGKFNAYQRTYVITVNEKQKILYRYLYFQLLKSLKEFKEMSVGANTRFLKLGMIQGLKIALPTVEEQQTIVRQLDALRAETQKLETIYLQKINNLEELKKSILDKAFKGEL